MFWSEEVNSKRDGSMVVLTRLDGQFGNDQVSALATVTMALLMLNRK